MPNKPKIVWSICELCKHPYRVAAKELRKGRRFCGHSCASRGKKYIKRNQSGENNPNWKGGRTSHSKGYVYRYMPFHHRAHNGYVLEHILIMEEKIGRCLMDGEVVHHKDGVKSNNSPDNLGLFESTGSHTEHHNSLRGIS